MCREEYNVRINHKPTSFMCPLYRKLSRETQMKHFESDEGFKLFNILNE